jgi:hypothetical protein
MVARIAKRFGALTSMPRSSSSSLKRLPLSVLPWHSPRWFNSHGKSTPLSTNGNCGWSGYAMRRNEHSGNTRGDPDNRLVAWVLESQWEEKLRVVEQTEHDYETWKRANRTELTSQERAEILAIGEDLPRVWHAETTCHSRKPEPVTILDFFLV